MNTSNPSVSVIVTTYNQAPYIGAALRSALDQSYPPSEVIVVDDGSSDRTQEVLAGFASAIKSIRQTNVGVAGSRNRGVDEATGDLIALMDGDDLWEPDKLARQVRAFQAYPDSGLVACDARQFEDDRIIWDRVLVSLVPDLFDDGETDVVSRRCYERLLRGQFIATTSQVLIPRAVLQSVGPSDVTLRTCSDYDLYLRVAARYPLTFVNAPLTRWRYLATSASGPAGRRSLRWGEDAIVILKRQRQLNASIDPRTIKHATSTKVSDMARIAYTRGSEVDRMFALGYLWHLAVRNPTNSVVWFYLGGLLTGPRIVNLAGPRIRALLRKYADQQGRGLWADRSV